MLSLSGALLLKEDLKLGRRSLVTGTVDCRSLLLKEDYKLGRRSLVMLSLRSLVDYKLGRRSLVTGNVVPQWTAGLYY